MWKNSIMELERRLMAGVYAKRPLALVKGRGDLVWDAEGREYVDCAGAYGTALLGHCHPRVVEAVKRQVEALISCHGSAYNDARAALLEGLAKIFPKPLTKFFLSNSGAEAVECALKLARKFTGRMEVVAMKGAYHGKTLGALAATWSGKYRAGLEPLLSGVKHAPYGDAGAVEEAVGEETAAVIAEPIQGESGVRIPPAGFLKELRRICDEKGALLILDEVQTGFGRTGRVFCFEHSGVVPDIVCLAKGVAGGLPIGVTAARPEVMDALKVGEHTSTYGGNPVVSAAARAAIDALIEERLPERAWETGLYFMARLEEVASKHKIIREVRGMGLMIGVEFRFDALDILEGLRERGVLALDAGRTVVRFLPPLVVTKPHIDKVVEALDGAVEDKERRILRGQPA